MIKVIVNFKNSNHSMFIDFVVLPNVGDLISIDNDKLIDSGLSKVHEVVGVMHVHSSITNNVEVNLLTIPSKKYDNYVS